MHPSIITGNQESQILATKTIALWDPQTVHIIQISIPSIVNLWIQLIQLCVRKEKEHDAMRFWNFRQRIKVAQHRKHWTLTETPWWEK